MVVYSTSKDKRTFVLYHRNFAAVISGDGSMPTQGDFYGETMRRVLKIRAGTAPVWLAPNLISSECKKDCWFVKISITSGAVISAFKALLPRCFRKICEN